MARRTYADLPEPLATPVPDAIRRHALTLRTAFADRIKATHDKRCSNWETWESDERDQTGRKFRATWIGCRACHVAILEN